MVGIKTGNRTFDSEHCGFSHQKKGRKEQGAPGREESAHCVPSLICFISVLKFLLGCLDLQCCISCRCTEKRICLTGLCIQSFLDSSPIQVIMEYSVEFPVLYSKSLIVVY